MNIKEALFFDRSRRNIDFMADELAWDVKNFGQLIEIVFEDSEYSMRAAWLMEACFKRNSNIIVPYLEKLIKYMGISKDQGVDRNITKILMVTAIPDDYAGLVWDSCYKWLFSATKAIAVRANAMTILYNISQDEPELKPELLASIEESMHEGSVGLKSRAKKLIKELKSQIENNI